MEGVQCITESTIIYLFNSVNKLLKTCYEGPIHDLDRSRDVFPMYKYKILRLRWAGLLGWEAVHIYR